MQFLNSKILRAESVHKVYEGNGNKSVLKPTSISINKGSIHVIEGKSGSGKSTLLSILGGMEFPSSGKVFFENRSIYDLADSEQAMIRGQYFGFVFQSFHLIPELTIRENIGLPLHFSKQKNKDVVVEELAEQVGIAPHLSKKPSYLSGGEQQRVAIARALVSKPSILFADEPTGNLDEDTSQQIVKLLINYSYLNNTALVIVTHEKQLIKQPHNLYTMADGLLKADKKND
ncbi:ABC transporter ATP-binding protein [Bacillus canaveralius]|nr:ABC transporter ATP-binding protein [Bacillus canaveralius]